MSEPFLGQIMIVGFNFPPRGWAFCEGQVLPISQNQSLFSLLGTTYGGDGRTTFVLPDLRGRVPISPGQGPGLSNYRWGDNGGAEAVALTAGQIPSHNHSAPNRCNTNDGETDEPNGNFMAKAGGGETIYASSANADMGGGAVTGNAGGGQQHNNIQPYLSIYFCIALQGIFPSRN